MGAEAEKPGILDTATPTSILAVLKPLDWVDFRRIAGDESAARSRFEGLIASLVVLVRPGAYQPRGDGGDWGLDVVYGELIPGEVIAVWQAKYFPNHLRSGERTKIIASFGTAIRKASEHGYQIGQWTLAVPLKLTSSERSWWGKFKREGERDHGLKIELWESTELDRRLQAREASRLRMTYFGTSEPPLPLEIAILPDAERYDSALFVKQLVAAGIEETQAARQQFFNAEVLRREVRNKALEDEVGELEQRSMEVLSIWEGRFAGAGPTEADARLLYRDVLMALETHHRGSSLRSLRASLVHTLGLMQFHVDERHAGWVRAWREVADAHAG